MSTLMHLLLSHGQQRRIFLDACVIKSPWLIHPYSLLVVSFGRSNREIRCLSSQSMLSTNASDPLQWWDNRVDKMNSKLPDFKLKATKESLRVYGWSTPPWVKAMLTQRKLQSHVGFHTNDSRETAHQNRLPKGTVGRRNTLPTSARGESEAIVVLKKRLQQGIAIDSYMYVEVLKRCLKQKDLVAAKEVHDCIIESGMDQNVHVVNTLLIVYIRCGRLHEARRVFDELEKKEVISWNIMIGGYAQHSRCKDAMKIFNQMRQDGTQPNEVTYLSILKACASPSALKWGQEVHGYIRHGGFESDVRVGTALLKMYAKCGSIKEARNFFDKLASRNVISWNVMIGAYAESGYGKEAYKLLVQMKQEGFKPDAITYTSILNGSASAGALEWVKEVHNHVLEAGLESDLQLNNALVHMYAKSGSINFARLVFDRMQKRDVITWNVMIGAYAEGGRAVEAYGLFHQMIQEGLEPNAITYMSILNACASAGAFEWAKDIHSHVHNAGLESDVMRNVLVHMYAKSGIMDDARLVFDRMEKRNVITWNVMIGAYVDCGCFTEAYGLFLQMIREGFKPNAITYVSILKACASAGAVKDVHRHAHEAGLESDMRVGSALVHMYAKSDSIEDARLVFDKMTERDVITWTTMIGAYAEHGCGVEAYGLFLQMILEGFKPNAITYTSILNASASAGALEWVKDVHRHACDAGLDSDVRVGSALVHMYAKSGSIDDARFVFDNMQERDLITWNVMIGGLAQHGCGSEALDLLREMNVKPDGSTFVAVLSACSHAGLVDEGRQLFSAMSRDYGIEPSVVHCTCMVDLLARAGHLGQAKLFIDSLPVVPNGATWGALLGACRAYGNVELGELAAKERIKLEPEDASTYVLLSNIYAAADKVQEVSLVRRMMQERGIRKEPGRSWIQVDNKIHEFVAGDRSHPEAKEIYAELSRLTEKIKAEGYLPDTRLVLHDIDEKDKELSLCSHSEKLAIAYGVLRSSSSKPVHVFKNLRVCLDCHTATKFISKVTGKEIVVRDMNRFHHFKDGACSCQDYW